MTHHRRTRIASWLAVVALLLNLWPAAATAAAEPCSCGTRSIESRLDEADAVFIGTAGGVAATVDTPVGAMELREFEVERTYRGPVARTINVGGGGEHSNCAVVFNPGEQVGVLANWQAGHLVAGRCGIVNPDELRALGPGDLVVSSFPVGTVVAIAGIALGFGVALALRARRGIASVEAPR